MIVRPLVLVLATLLPACVGDPAAGTGSTPPDLRPCRTSLDCSVGEVCAVDGAELGCRPADADDPMVPDGPEGQPAPPLGLLEGTARLSRTGDVP